MFGLPTSTTLVAFGLPCLIAIALFIWGVRFRAPDDSGAPDDRGPK